MVINSSRFSKKKDSALKAVYPGSFDPPTLGHIDIIKRALNIFDELIVLVAESSKKSSFFTIDERKELLALSLKDTKNVKIDSFGGLTVDYTKKVGAKVIIRGLRAVSDFEYEFQMATMNRKLRPDIETMVIMTGEEFFYISSNTVKEVAMHGGDISQVVPPAVVKAVAKKLKN
jgi:pantetheine-phosphate adenylyltransferase